MPTRDTNWPTGTPSWVDLTVAEPEAARAFYGGLFGWEFEVGGEEAGFYSQARLQGRTVAGIGQVMPDEPTPPPAWLTYLATDDTEATTARITAAGGTVVVPTLDVMGLGRMAVATDPTGCVFGLWQGATHTGFERYNEPGAVAWNEALVDDFEAAKTFYRAAVGYTVTDIGGGQFSYVTLEVDGRTVGGLGEAADSPPHWLTYFDVEDPDRTVQRAGELGATVVTELHDSPYGRMATLTGPTGERFAVIRGADPDS